MNIKPHNQINLYGLENQLVELINLHNKDKLPNKILLSGLKGTGKCTLAYHLINFVLSQNENTNYDLKNFRINIESKSFKLIQNGSNPNFTLIDILSQKKTIDITQIRELISKLHKSSFNDKPRFILIDNIENLNLNSINALLKILEEPSENTYFILIHNNKKVLPTLLSRCLSFNIHLSNNDSNLVCEKLFKSNISKLISNDLLDYYFTPGQAYDLLRFSTSNDIDLTSHNLKSFLLLFINKTFYKKDSSINYIVFGFIEFYLVKKINLLYSNVFNYFVNRINDTRKFNLDEESLFLEVKTKLLNG